MLIASSGSLEDLRGAVTDFYCGTAIQFHETEPGRWAVVRTNDGKTLPGVIVRRQGRRYRFEGV